MNDTDNVILDDQPGLALHHWPTPTRGIVNGMKIVPLGDRVLIDVHPPDEKTKGGLIVPENARGVRERHFRGEVIAKGNKVSAEIDVGVVVRVPCLYTPDEVLEAHGQVPTLIIIKEERITAIEVPVSTQ